MLSLRRIALLALLCLPVTGAFAQDPEVGQLLVANPALDDPNYARTVLLLVHHAEDGSIAVALDRPTWVEPAEAFPEVPELAAYTDRLHFGGPVSPAQPLIVFERGANEPENSRHVKGSVYVTTDLGQLAEMDLTGENPPRVRLFAGHAAWGPGQLAEEIENGTWRTAPSTTLQIFTSRPSELWRSIPLTFDEVTAARD